MKTAYQINRANSINYALIIADEQHRQLLVKPIQGQAEMDQWKSDLEASRANKTRLFNELMAVVK